MKISDITIFVFILSLLSFSCKDKPGNLVPGTVDDCKVNPKFLSKYHLKPPVFIDLRQKTEKGFEIREARPNGKSLRLPSWQKAGELGAFTMDDKGNIYISPMPYVSLYNSPLDYQNILYKVDTYSGVMDSFFKVDYIKPPHSSNPFGITGMTYDCETNFLYTSSVAGSTFNDEIGMIQKIDLSKKIVISSFKNIDALGIVIFKTRKNKRLYFGLARQPEIYSIALDENGDFVGNSRFEISLVEASGGNYDKCQNISIKNDIMTVKAIDFNFTLMASSDPMRNIYRFKYDRKNDKWQFLDVHKQ